METDDKLIEYVKRIESLEEEKQDVCSDIREVYSELKGAGYDVKAVRQVIKLRKMENADRQEYRFLTDEYAKILGME